MISSEIIISKGMMACRRGILGFVSGYAAISEIRKVVTSSEI
jgi:hypothetical protein